MLPNIYITPQAFERMTTEVGPSKGFKLDEQNYQISGMIDEIDSLRQSIHCILRTERGKYPIYSNSYGVDLGDIYGKDRRFVLPQLEMRISDALTQDDRIIAVNNFSFSTERNKYVVSFVVENIFQNNIPITEEVIV